MADELAGLPKLTKAQRSMLEAGKDGVLGFGPHRAVQDLLRFRGLLSMERDELGYYRITDAGRRALEASHG